MSRAGVDLEGLVAHNRARNARSRPRTGLRGPDGREIRARKPKPPADEDVATFRSRAIRYGLLVLVVGLGFGLASLRVRLVQVDDLLLADREHVRTVLMPALESRLIGLDVEDLAAKLEGDPWISSASVARRLDGRILVDVEEARPVLRRASEGEGVGAIDRSGRVLPPREGLDLTHLPLLLDYTVEGDRLSESDARRLDQLLAAAERSSWPLDTPLARIHLRGPRGLELVTREGVRIVVGDGALDRRLRSLAAALERWDPSAGDTLDLRFERQVVHVPSSQAATAAES